MAIAPRLEIRQTQSLVMTPQLQQAIKLLQLSNLELLGYVETELEQNPLLERAEPEADASEPYDGHAAAPVRDAADGVKAETLPSDDGAPLDADYDNVYDRDTTDDRPESSGLSQSGGVSRAGGPEDGTDFDRTPGSDKSLREHLLDQLAVDVADPVDRIIGRHLIDLVDEAGYIAGDIAEIAERLDCAPGRVEAALAIVQQFDPPGVFARDLKECLALQLRDRDRFDPAMAALVDNLELLAKRDLATLMKLCGVDGDDMAEMIAELRALNPKPGLVFDQDVTRTVVPDVFVRRLPDGGWLVELNSDTLPRLLINAQYHRKVSGAARSREDKAYISDRLQSANWLIKSLDQRANTILRVASELVRQQEGFFERGVEFLRPLTLRDIAETIAMHESTVSRVTTNKYMATPRGIFEMKYFFTSAITNSQGGDAHSAESVRHRIKALIDREAPDAVLSDDHLVKILRDSGIDIARRTVAKYREAMRIPSSVQRRRMKSVPA